MAGTTVLMDLMKQLTCAKVRDLFCELCNFRVNAINFSNTYSIDLPCGPNAFRCRNKRCIRKSAQCDGVRDCGANDDSDENEASCSLYHKCTAKQFQCVSDQYCISKQYRCDNEQNCESQNTDM